MFIEPFSIQFRFLIPENTRCHQLTVTSVGIRVLRNVPTFNFLWGGGGMEGTLPNLYVAVTLYPAFDFPMGAD